MKSFFYFQISFSQLLVLILKIIRQCEGEGEAEPEPVLHDLNKLPFF